MTDLDRAMNIQSRLKAMYANGTSAAELGNIFNLSLDSVKAALGIPEPPEPEMSWWQRLIRR